MNLEKMPLRPHVSGYIWLDTPGGDGEPSFRITRTHHDQDRLPSDKRVDTPPPYVLHPLHERLLEAGDGASRSQSRAKRGLSSIAVRVLFDTPENNVMARYEGWSERSESQPTCIGNGQYARAMGATGAWSQIACRGPDLCPQANSGAVRCAPSVRMLVTVPTVQGMEDEVFELRCGSINTYRSLLGALAQLDAQGYKLSATTLELSGWLKSLKLSDYEAFACARLRLGQDGDRQRAQQRAQGSAEQSEREQVASQRWEAFGAQARAQWLSEVTVTAWDAMEAPQIQAANDDNAHSQLLLANGAAPVSRAHARANAPKDIASLFAGPLQQAMGQLGGAQAPAATPTEPDSQHAIDQGSPANDAPESAATPPVNEEHAQAQRATDQREHAAANRARDGADNPATQEPAPPSGAAGKTRRRKRTTPDANVAQTMQLPMATLTTPSGATEGDHASSPQRTSVESMGLGPPEPPGPRVCAADAF